jgi:hypothetical protein
MIDSSTSTLPPLDIPTAVSESCIDGQPEPIPPIPLSPSNNIITGAEYRAYIRPLFTRWWKFRMAKTSLLYDGVKLRYPQFSRTFMFRDTDTTLDFIRDCNPWLAEYTAAKPMDQGVRTS